MYNVTVSQRIDVLSKICVSLSYAYVQHTHMYGAFDIKSCPLFFHTHTGFIFAAYLLVFHAITGY